LLGTAYPARLAALTVAGVLAMYGADRAFERRWLAATAARHHAPRSWSCVFGGIAALSGLFGVSQLAGRDLIWLLILGSAGALYLALTANRLKSQPPLKELTGAFCFAAVVWGAYPEFSAGPVDAFVLLAISNFLWSGCQDRERDLVNGVRSLAVAAPRANVALARGAALLSAALFLAGGYGRSPFPWAAVLHFGWPSRNSEWSIDLALAPLLAAPFLAQMS